MGKYFAQIMAWAILLTFFCPSTLCAEEPPTAEGEKTLVSEVSLATPPEAEVTPEKIPLFRHNNYPDAWRAAQKSNRPILVYVCMPNCPHCVKMMEQTYEVPHVEKLVSSSFETIHVGRYKNAQLVQKLRIKWFPTTVLVGPNNKVLDMIEGYVDAKKFQQRLQTGLASITPTTQTR